jgi:hypothetical protein
MTTTATIELTDRQVAHRVACAALKNLIKQLIEEQRTLKAEHKLALQERRWQDTCYGAIESGKDTLTTLHVIHNRIRHNRPHLGTPEKDAMWISNATAEKFLSRHLNAEEAAAVKEVL